jgi:hypothetical protein
MYTQLQFYYALYKHVFLTQEQSFKWGKENGKLEAEKGA